MKRRVAVQRERVQDTGQSHLHPPVSSMGDSPAAAPASARSGGEELSAETRSFFEPRFGHDFSRVRIHADAADAASAESIGAQAYTAGGDIVFGTGRFAPSTDSGRRLLGHELAHVVQQSRGEGYTPAGPRPASSARSTDALESEAGVVGSHVAEGGHAVGAIAGVAPYAIQRFNEDEHRDLGAVVKRRVPLAPDYSVEYREMVAMAGDHFESLDQMKALAAVPGKGAGTREELEYVRIVKVLEQKRAGEFSDSAKQAADARYYKLAANNPSHFPNARAGDEKRSHADKAGDVTLQLPISGTEMRANYDADTMRHMIDAGYTLVPQNAPSGYRINHIRALITAVAAGRSGKPVDEALAYEAFADHYLTDMFSGGHLRVARASIKEYWDTRVPMFFYNLKGYIAEKVAKELAGTEYRWGPVQLREDTVYVGVPHVKEGALGTVSRALDAIGPLNFGDVVSGAIHDHDGKLGVKASVGDETMPFLGDGSLGTEAMARPKAMAEIGIRLGVSEVESAHAMGSRGISAAEVVRAALSKEKVFGAERMIPKVRPDAEQDPGREAIKWDFGTWSELLHDKRFKAALETFCSKKASTIDDVAKDGFSDAQRAAIKKKVSDPMRAGADSAARVLEAVIGWTPGITDSLGGHNVDDNANAYWREAKKTPGGLASLTYGQRERLTSNLVEGATVGDDEDAVMDILRSAPAADRRRLIDRFGWERLHDEIDDWSGEDFAESFPKAVYGK